jgi:hypothetical protein
VRVSNALAKLNLEVIHFLLRIVFPGDSTAAPPGLLLLLLLLPSLVALWLASGSREAWLTTDWLADFFELLGIFVRIPNFSTCLSRI